MTADETEVPVLVTEVGKAIDGDNLFRGHRVGRDLAGRDELWSVTSIALGGPRLDPEQAAVLDDITVCCLAADPRIWPLKSTRLAASFGSKVVGVAVGMLAAEGSRIGPRMTSEATRFLGELSQTVGSDPSPARVASVLDQWVASNRPMVGFGVPFRARDERLDALRRCMRERGRDQLPAWRLLEAADRHLAATRRSPANIGAGIAAALLDLGIEPSVIEGLQWMFINPCLWANAHEGARKREPVLQRLPDAMIEYVGPAPRVSPRQRDADRGGDADPR